MLSCYFTSKLMHRVRSKNSTNYIQTEFTLEHHNKKQFKKLTLQIGLKQKKLSDDSI